MSLLLAPAACAPAAEPDAAVEAEDEAALRALSSAEIVGTLSPGETKTVAYTRAPLYRALKVELAAGAAVDVSVRSETGDARAWLLGPAFQTLARSNDVSDTDTNARIERTVSRAGTYYVVFREEKLKDATFRVSLAGAAPPPAAGRCTSDTECGGGSAMCFIDRCVTVSDEVRVATGIWRGPAVAYSQAGQLELAYTHYQSSSGTPSSVITLHKGVWGGPTTSSGASSDTQFHFDEGPGRDPLLAASTEGYTGEGVSLGGSGTALGYHESVRHFAVGRNRAGTQFVAMVASTPAAAGSSYGGARCSLRFAARAAGGAWSGHELVDTCTGTYRSLAIHVRADGAADIVAAPEFGGIVRYHRANPIDAWAKTLLVPTFGTQGRSTFVAAHGEDGTTHLAAQPYEYGSSSSEGDYTASYVELGDDGVVRQTALGTYRQQLIAPLVDIGVDGSKHVWLLKRPRELGDRGALVRVDGTGTAVERSVGPLPPRSNVNTSLAIAPSGEIAVLATVGATMSLRRFTPVDR